MTAPIGANREAGLATLAAVYAPMKRTPATWGLGTYPLSLKLQRDKQSAAELDRAGLWSRSGEMLSFLDLLGTDKHRIRSCEATSQ